MSIRTERARVQVRNEIARMLLNNEIHDPRLVGMVSITDVKMSRDLQHATVFFSVMGDDFSHCQKVLTGASGFIRGQLGRRLKLRQVPHLRFQPDTSLDQAKHIEGLLETLNIPPADDPTIPETDDIKTIQEDT